jgi:hypothetical protein
MMNKKVVGNYLIKIGNTTAGPGADLELRREEVPDGTSLQERERAPAGT